MSVVVASIGLAELNVDPEVLRYAAHAFVEVVHRAVTRYGGTLAKAAQGEVVAWFGAPLSREDDPERSVRSALEVIEAYSVSHAQAAGTPQIGIATGWVVSGPLQDVQSSFTVLGPTVQVARQLAEDAGPGEVLIASATQRLVTHIVVTTPARLRSDPPAIAHRVIKRRPERLTRALSPLVGRAPELAYLERAMRHVERQHQGLCVAVVGEAGVGKTRLIEEFSALTTPGRRWTAKCASFDSETPYGLVAQLIRTALGLNPAVDAHAARVLVERSLQALDLPVETSELQLLLRVLGYGDNFPYSPEARLSVLTRFVRELLRRSTATAALLIVMEDVHWADRPSLLVLGDAFRDLSRSACLLVTTARPEWRAPWPAEHLELQRLSSTAARTLAANLLQSAPISAIDALLERAGGNPFFLEEFALSGRDGDEPTQLPHWDAPVPLRIQELIQARLDALPEMARPVLRVAAIAGQRVRVDVLAQLFPGVELHAALDALVREQILVAPPIEMGTMSFRHALIHEVAYSAQVRGQRERFHTAIGAALERLYRDRGDELVGELAFHYGRGVDDRKALTWLVRAADRAQALFANQEAINLYAAALARANALRDDSRSVAILQRMAEVHLRTATFDEAVRCAQQALAVLSSDDGKRAAELWQIVGTACSLRSEFAEAARAFEKALTAGREHHAVMARVRVALGHMYFRRGEHARAREELGQIFAPPRRSIARDTAANALKYLGNVAVEVGDLRAAEAYYERSRRLFQRLEDLIGLADLQINLGIVCRRTGRWSEALALFNASLALNERMGRARYMAICHNNMGEVHMTAGALESAKASFERALALHTAIGDPLYAGLALIGRAAARIYSGDAEGGRADLVSAEAKFAEVGSSLYFPDLYRYFAIADIARGDLDAAYRSAERAGVRPRRGRTTPRRHDSAGAGADCACPR